MGRNTSKRRDSKVDSWRGAGEKQVMEELKTRDKRKNGQCGRRKS